MSLFLYLFLYQMKKTVPVHDMQFLVKEKTGLILLLGCDPFNFLKNSVLAPPNYFKMEKGHFVREARVGCAAGSRAGNWGGVTHCARLPRTGAFLGHGPSLLAGKAPGKPSRVNLP